MTDLVLVKIYMEESEESLNEVLRILHDEIKVQHTVVLRAIEGFEKDGKMHSSHFLSLSLDLPLVLEFFDTDEKTSSALKKIQETGIKGHILKLPVQALS
ncbi:MAG: DUF190 domain-containing protein [Simkaniaceae bacterium]|nr:DUF190 domain-containing protein [Simkaniaceae bacterium]